MSGAEWVWLVMGAAVVAYVLTGGADYGGGILHLIVRKESQRTAIREAIAPIWEANHVWLIFVIVLCFTAFPIGFAVVSTALHIPVTLVLIAMVFRGSAFVFHAYGSRERALWPPLFGGSSVAAPFLLGLIAAALSSGQIRWDGHRVTSGFFAGWLTGYAALTGLFALALFALLAAVYLTVETDGEDAEHFRRIALGLEGISGALAASVLAAAARDAPLLYDRLLRSAWTLPIQGLTAATALASIACLWRRRYRFARAAVAAQVALVVLGWGFAMDGAIVPPDVSIDTAGAQPRVVRALLPVVAGGGALLAPSLWYLFRVFKRGNAAARAPR